MKNRILAGWLTVATLGLCVTASDAVADGTATASVTVDGKTFTFSGGSCARSGDVLSVNIGVPSSQAPAGTHPDYFGVYIPKAPGTFDEGTVTFTKDGKRYGVGRATGEATDSGASFSGKLMRGSGTVTGSFKC
jgi:hypothetical protein